jgi:predicted CXXCH cytochrome family protein
MLLLLAGPLLYAGAEACASCHRAEYDKQIASRHAHALRPIAGSTLKWAFGAGAQGITPVGMVGAQYFENRYSYYPQARRYALTFGHPANGRLGLLQDDRTITQCFNCHATNVQSGPDLSSMTTGIKCERCHGPGRAHVAAPRTAMLNPGRLAPKSQVQICGECHRLPQPGNSSPEPEIEDPVSVRFAPIGLMASRCFIESRKLACTTCHDPHTDARPRLDRSYTERCLTCHADVPAAAGACRRASRENCLTCHMRQVALTDYLKFTDHRIRIY